jgi:hypothetical protein
VSGFGEQAAQRLERVGQLASLDFGEIVRKPF